MGKAWLLWGTRTSLDEVSGLWTSNIPSAPQSWNSSKQPMNPAGTASFQESSSQLSSGQAPHFVHVGVTYYSLNIIKFLGRLISRIWCRWGWVEVGQKSSGERKSSQRPLRKDLLDHITAMAQCDLDWNCFFAFSVSDITFACDIGWQYLKLSNQEHSLV